MYLVIDSFHFQLVYVVQNEVREDFRGKKTHLS